MGIILLQDTGVVSTLPPVGADGTILVLEPEAGSTYSFEYRTDVHKSWDGRERRVALLGYPRESFEARFLIQDEDTFRTLRSLRTRFPTDAYLMVAWHEGAAAQGAITSTTVLISTTQTDWAQTGRRVWVDAGDGRGYYGVIQSVLFTSPYRTLTLDAAPPGTFADGSAIVYPLRAYYLEDASPVERYAVNSGYWSVKGRAVEPFTTAIGTGATIATLGGVPFLDVLPIVRGSDAEDRPIGNVDMLDAGAKIAPEWSFRIADIARTHIFQIASAADRQYWKKFYQTVMGRQKAFLLPTYRPDIDAYSIIGDVIFAFYDTEAGFADYGGHNWVRIVATSGAVTTHSVVTTDNDVDGDGNPIIFITVTPTPPALASISEIQWIEKVRFADDQFTWTQMISGRQEMTLRFLVTRQ